MPPEECMEAIRALDMVSLYQITLDISIWIIFATQTNKLSQSAGIAGPESRPDPTSSTNKNPGDER